MDGIRRGDSTSGMGVHIRQEHPEVDVSHPESLIEMSIIDQRPKNMERGIAEAVLIDKVEKDSRYTTTNRKAEWGRAPIRRIGVYSNLQ